ncbi:MAG: adenylate cyclase [Actinomycetota bacterium]|nr:adenylate cyclase [Actinomycetota bacterium]
MIEGPSDPADDADDASHEHDALVAAGLYDPASADAAARLALLHYLLGLGLSMPELVQASVEQRILSVAALNRLRPVGERLTLSEVAARAGIDEKAAQRLWRAAGFADTRRHERRFSAADVEMLAVFGELGALVGSERVVQLVRIAGAATASLAEAETALLRSSIEAPLVDSQDYVEIARSYVGIVTEVLPRLSAAIDTLHRHHLDSIGRRYSDSGAPPSATNTVDLAIGFADLAGYTSLSGRLDTDALISMIDAFESTALDLVAASGARVVKRMGDAVMFMTPAPGVACDLALDLVDAATRDPRLPPLRVGLAFGPVIVRGGDVYGPFVNLASRLCAAAEPGAIVVSDAIESRLRRLTDRYCFAGPDRLILAGFGEVVPGYGVERA